MSTFWQLLKIDLVLIKDKLKDSIINTIIWAGSIALVSTYLLQPFGLSENFGMFQAVSLIVNIGIFEIYAQLFGFLADIEGEKHITYQVTLPLPTWQVFLKMAVSQTISIMILTVCCIPVLKLILWNTFSVMDTLNPLFILMSLLVSAFGACFTIFLAGTTKSMHQIGNVIMRIIFPLFFFGGFSFSFYSAYSISPTLAYLSLISPFTYATEAARAILLGPDAYIPLWISFLVLLIITILSFYIGSKLLKKKLDLI